MSLNETCFPIDPQDILPDGTPCIQGFCNKVKLKKDINDSKEFDYYRIYIIFPGCL